MDFDFFDERICILGESPSASGERYAEISWVDILGSRVLTRNLDTGASSEFPTFENVGFAIRRTTGGYVLGTNSGPILRDPDGSMETIFSLQEVDPNTKNHAVRWNDAKASPQGNLFLGTMGYEMLDGTSTLFKFTPTSKELDVVLPGLTISNGMDWSDDGRTYYFIDSNSHAIRSFAVENDEVTEIRKVVEISPAEGNPDGMCIDSEGGIWVVLWGGGEVRRYDSKNNFELTERVKLPAIYVTSCAFVGENLDTLIITSATDGKTGLSAESGMTFSLRPGVTGRPSRLLNM
jgi:gluconolactonase